MNSFSGVERALEAEFARQMRASSSAGGPSSSRRCCGTRIAERCGRLARKEGSHDYRYFPEPDLPPLRLTNHWIGRLRERLPELPDAKRRRFAQEHQARRRTTSTCSPRARASPSTSRRSRTPTAMRRRPRTG